MDLVRLLQEMSKTGVISSLVIIVMAILAGRYIYELVEWLLGIMNKYHMKLDRNETLEETTNKLMESIQAHEDHIASIEKRLNGKEQEKRIEELERCAIERAEKLDRLNDNVSSLVKALERFQRETKEALTATMKVELYDLYRQSQKDKYITQASAESFSALSRCYLAWGNNSIFKNKIIPHYMGMPMKDIDSITISETEDIMEGVKSQLRESDLEV